jgi:potassium channel LctB
MVAISRKRIFDHRKNISKLMKLFLRVSKYLGWKTLIITTFFTVIAVSVLSSINFLKTALLLVFLYILYLILQTVSFVYESIKSLLDDNKKSLGKILSAYMISIIGLILLFAMFYKISLMTGTGYLTYSQCSDKLSMDSFLNDDKIIFSTFGNIYFSAITFFSVGYGDICPMGVAKFLAIINSWLGHAYSVIILGMALAIYTKDKR